MSPPPPEDNPAGKPGYPSPWATARPLEGLRDTDAARIVSLAPDVCLTPMGSVMVPVPYPVVDYCGHDQNYTETVRFTGQKAMVLRSSTTHVHGDAPGTGKGVKSGTVEGISEPIGHAAQVRAEGSPVIRHLDRFWMNNRNTVGEAIFVRDTTTHPAPPDDDPFPGSLKRSEEPAQGPPASKLDQAASEWSALRGATPPAREGSGGSDASGGALGFVGPPPAVAPPTMVTPPAVAAPGAGAAAAARLGLGTILTGIGVFGTVLLTPTNEDPVNDRIPEDDWERQRVEEARRVIRERPLWDRFWDSGRSIGDQARRDIDLRRQAQAQAERDTQTAPAPAPGPGNGRVSQEDGDRCPWIVICFMPSPRAQYDPQEFERQVTDQSTALNRLSPTEYLDNRNAVRAAGSTRPFRETRAAKDAYNRIWRDFRQQNPNYSDDGSAAALHALDIVAGGYGHRYLRMGPSQENSIIGALWSQNQGVRGGDRLRRLDAHAERLRDNGCPRMNARLQVCPSNATE